jgi:hypothetical protein
MTVERCQIVNIRTGQIVAEFDDYIPAFEYRRDVLTPKLAQPWKCPYHIVFPDDPDYIAAQAEFDRFRRQSEADIAALPVALVQGELFDIPELVDMWKAGR